MPYSLSASTRLLIAMLLLLALAFQAGFSFTHFIGQVYARNGRISVDQSSWKETVWYYEHAIEWFPHNHHWWFAKGQGHQGLRDVENTATAFNQAYALAPNHVASIASLAYEVRDLAKPAEIQNIIDRGLELTPHYWNLHYTQGLLQMRTGDRAGAKKPLSQAQRNATLNIALMERSIAFQALATADLDRAEYAIDKAIKRDKTMPELWQLRGQILHSSDDPQAAIPAYEQSIDLYTQRIREKPETAQADARLRGETQAYLAHAHAALDHDAQAVENFAASTTQYVDIAFFGASIDIINARLTESGNAQDPAWANVLSAAGRHAAAIQIYTEVQNTNPQALTRLERYYWANALRQSGNLFGALEQFKKMSQMTWTDAMAYAETLAQSGQPAAANYEYNRILTGLQLNPQQRQLVEQRITALGQ